MFEGKIEIDIQTKTGRLMEVETRATDNQEIKQVRERLNERHKEDTYEFKRAQVDEFFKEGEDKPIL